MKNNPKGQRQSPINVVPEELLFDPGLDPIYINQNQVYELFLITIGVFYFLSDPSPIIGNACQ